MLAAENQRKNNGFHQAQALSIASLVIYYLWPKVFPNGYLGIDIFFVTSGFAMTSNKPLSTIKRLKKFYFKHIKMLIPFHLISVLIIMIISSYLLGTSYFINISGDGMLAMSFVQNLNIWFQKYNLFNLMEESAYFLHTWLLCNQLIFCLFAPFISYFNLQTQQSVSFFLAILFSSFLLQCFYTLKTNYYVLFFPNLWQYLIGTGTFLLIKNQKHQNVLNLTCLNKLKMILMENNKVYISSLLLLFGGILIPLHSNILNILVRIVVSLSTATMILSYPTKQSNNLFDKFICYISNAFYSIYLTSLSIIFFANQIGIIRLPHFKFALLLMALVISITVHELIQKPLQFISNNATTLLVGVLYLLITYLCFYLLTYPPD